jgi:ribosome maturation factor RimP
MMYADDLLPRLEPLARRAAESEGLQLEWLELKRQGGSWVFRVFIDRAEGSVGLSDCERVGDRLGLLLDIEDPIDSAYTLEVSTPGLDRPLHGEKDYLRFEGRLARLKTRELVSGRRHFSGRLAGVRDGAVLLEDRESGTVSIPLSAIAGGRLEVEIGSPAREGGPGRSSRPRKKA